VAILARRRRVSIRLREAAYSGAIERGSDGGRRDGAGAGLRLRWADNGTLYFGWRVDVCLAERRACREPSGPLWEGFVTMSSAGGTRGRKGSHKERAYQAQRPHRGSVQAPNRRTAGILACFLSSPKRMKKSRQGCLRYEPAATELRRVRPKRTLSSTGATPGRRIGRGRAFGGRCDSRRFPSSRKGPLSGVVSSVLFHPPLAASPGRSSSSAPSLAVCRIRWMATRLMSSCTV